MKKLKFQSCLKCTLLHTSQLEQLNPCCLCKPLKGSERQLTMQPENFILGLVVIAIMRATITLPLAQIIQNSGLVDTCY